MSRFELHSLEKLLYDFYNLTGVKTCLYDSEGNELCYYPTKLSTFCKILREDPKTDALCKDCDRHAFATCRKTHSQHVYTCHAGLRECVSPVICDNRIIGFIMLGQIKSSHDAEPIIFQNEIPGERKERLRLAYDCLPSISNQKLFSAFRILDACAGYELLKTLLQVSKNSIEEQIEKFVNQNLSMPLSVPYLCDEFHLSRYEIYNICNKYFCCSPAEYIKKCRLTHACKLLTTTDLPIHEIALQCGIPDYNYFSKIFKAGYGISPSTYKKLHDSSNAYSENKTE